MNGVEVKCGWVEAVLERELKVEWMVDEVKLWRISGSVRWVEWAEGWVVVAHERELKAGKMKRVHHCSWPKPLTVCIWTFALTPPTLHCRMHCITASLQVVRVNCSWPACSLTGWCCVQCSC